MSVVFSGGTVVTASGCIPADVRIEGEKIVAVGGGLARKGDEVHDVAGKLLLPGGVDAHTHFEMPFCSTPIADTFSTGTAAALAGGTTTIIDYITQFHGQTLGEALSIWHSKTDGKCHCDYGFHMGVTDWNSSVKEEIGRIIAEGVPSFKMYMAYKGVLQVDDAALYQMLEALKKEGGLLTVHCENGDMVAERSRELIAQGNRGVRYHPQSRPEAFETESVNRLLTIAEEADAPVYVVHVSSAPSMQLIVSAKMRGTAVYAETCPQYLLLDDSRYELPGFEGAKYVISPPLRAVKNQGPLWAAVEHGLVDVLATDHCSFNFVGQKDAGRDDFTRIPNGAGGVEQRMMLLYSEGVAKGRMSLPRFVELTATNPARIFGLYPQKGAIIPSADADIVVLNPGGSGKISAATQYQNVDYTPYEGWNIDGAIDAVFLRGQRVVEGGKLLEAKAEGRFIKRASFKKGG